MALHPVFVSALDAARRSGRPALSAGPVQAAREAVEEAAKVLGPGEAVGSVEDCTIGTRAGALAARLYRPVGAARALLVYYHGGGWVAGSPTGFDALARTLAHRCQASVLLVDYRLAPEHPFPAAVEDAEDAARWAFANREALAGRDPRFVLAGDSAGANLAIVAATALRDELPIDLQRLFYPVTDTDPGTRSYRDHGEGYLLTAADMRWFLSHYAPPELWQDGRVAPLRHALIPRAPVWMALAEYDVLLSEGHAYAGRLREAGIGVECRQYAGLIHGFARWFNLVDAASAALDDAAAAVRALPAGHKEVGEQWKRK